MILIVGLGNPSPKYENTRHNAGFKAMDGIAEAFRFPAFDLQQIFNAKISKGKISEKEVILAKPQIFMNNSGKSVRSLVAAHKLPIASLFIINDDIDLPLGKIKISVGSGSAGHKGVQSIIDSLGTKEFVRFRIGICPEAGKPKNPVNFVLKKFTKEEKKILEEVIQNTVKAVEVTLKDGLEKAMNLYNK
ncbi:MAG: aminoacyl-tRNA hydrolase [bacterium]|nr:aminoacyl-tRNA hydrolase [bacterium]